MNSVKTPVASAMMAILLASTGYGQSSKVKLYVWDFTARNSSFNDLAEKLTGEFEEALVKSECYQVLERARFDRLARQSINEKKIQSLSNLSSASTQELRIARAQVVVFGMIANDVESGEFKVSVSFQSFDSTKVLADSVRLQQGRINDAESREKAMSELVMKLCRNTSRTNSPPTEDRSTARTKMLAGGGSTRQNKNFSVTLKGCTYNRDQVSCQFEFVNSLDREKPVTVNKTSKIYFGANSSSRIAEGSIPVKLNPKGRLTITATFQNVTLGTSSAQILLEIGGVGLERWSWDIYLK